MKPAGSVESLQPGGDSPDLCPVTDGIVGIEGKEVGPYLGKHYARIRRYAKAGFKREQRQVRRKDAISTKSFQMSDAGQRLSSHARRPVKLPYRLDPGG